MNQFARGAKVRQRPRSEMGTGLRAAQSAEITLGECIFATVDVRAKFYPTVTKEQLLRLVDRAWDAHASATAETCAEQPK